MSKRVKGIMAVMISAIVFGLMPLMAKIIYREGGNPIGLTFFRFIFLLPILYAIIKKNGDMTLKISKEELKQIIILSAVGYGATPLLLYSSYNYISSGLATTIHYIYPVFVILICTVFYKERASAIKIISLLFCLLGIVLFYDGNGTTNLIGLVFSFASGITFAFYTVYLDKSIVRKIHTLKTTFYLSLIASALLFIFGIITNSVFVYISPLGWLMSVILSLVVGFGGSYLFQIGVKAIGPQNTAILSTFEPITSVVVGLLVLSESFGIRTFFGIALILVAVVLISHFEV